MEQSVEYLGLFVTFVLAITIAGLILLLNSFLGPEGKTSAAKEEPFECGVSPIEIRTSAFPVKFYLIAMLFILFDVEIVWLFPWAVILKSLGWFGIATMFSFLLVLVLGFAYAWRKGALEWEK